MITFTFQDAKFQAEFSRKISVVKNPRSMLLNAGREVSRRLKAHFRERDKSDANQLSERRSHFWLAVSRTVQNPVLEGANTVTVSINDPRFAQKVFGGKIVAKAAGALTIPVEERAYDRTTAVFEQETGLKLFLLKAGGTASNSLENALLAVKEDGHITVEYLLTKSVDQKADPEALPDKTTLQRAILARSQRMLDQQMAAANPESVNPESI